MNAEPVLDLLAEEMDGRFAAASVYRKTAVVTIREAGPGETVHTVMADGRAETSVTCTGGEPVITNPGGEEYVPMGGWEQVERRYDALGDGRYRAKGMVRAFRNPTGRDVTIRAPWGELQNQGPDCWFAAEYLPGRPEFISQDRYLIGDAEFAETYVAEPRRLCRAVKSGGVNLHCTEQEGHDKGPDATWHKAVYIEHRDVTYDGARHVIDLTEAVSWEPVDRIAEAVRHLTSGRRS